MTQIQEQPQRTATRAPVGRRVKLQFDDSMDVVHGVCRNISIGGMFVAVENSRPKGSLVRFELEVDETASIRGLGEVVWMRAKSAGTTHEAGMGLKFRFLEQRDRQQIFKLVSQHIKERLGGREAPRGRPEAEEAGFEAAPEKLPATHREGLPGEIPPPAVLEEEEAPLPADPGPGATLSDAVPAPPSPPPAGDLSALLPEPPGGFDLGEVEGRAIGPMEAAQERSAEAELTDAFHAPPARRRTFPLLPVIVVSLVVALAAVYLFRAALFERADLGPPAPPVAPAVTKVAEGGRPPAPMGETGAPAADTTAPPADGGASTDTEEPSSGVETGAASAAPVAAPPEDAPGQRPSATFSRILDITWSRQGSGRVKVTILADGAIPQDRYDHFRLEGAQPREVIRFRGVAQAFDKATMTVGGPAVRQIRTGFHEKADGNELHVVVDLADPAATVSEIRNLGSRLEIEIASP